MANMKKSSKPIETSPSQNELHLANKINPKTFDGVKKAEIIRAASSTKVHSGPLPDPETLQAYKDIYPESVKIIFDTFQGQTRHRIDMETKVVTSQLSQSKFGQIYAFLIAILFLITSGYCILEGHDVAGGVLGTIDLIGLVTIFIKGKQYQANNLNEKNPQKTNTKSVSKKA